MANTQQIRKIIIEACKQKGYHKAIEMLKEGIRGNGYIVYWSDDKNGLNWYLTSASNLNGPLTFTITDDDAYAYTFKDEQSAEIAAKSYISQPAAFSAQQIFDQKVIPTVNKNQYNIDFDEGY